MTPFYESDGVALYQGDCLAVLAGLAEGSADAVVTDPPYALVEPRSVDGFGSMQRRGGFRTEDEKARRRGGFMGKSWDAELPGVGHWQAALRVLKPGGYLAAFGSPRTYHRLACAVEDAGFEVRDCVMWVYGSGFPKGDGCLKPAYEPVLLCRRPGPRVLPLQIDECRVPLVGIQEHWANYKPSGKVGYGGGEGEREGEAYNPAGRWPPNLAHDGSAEVLAAFAAAGERTSGSRKAGEYQPQGFYGNEIGPRPEGMERPMPELKGDTGTAARFYFCAKASQAEREAAADGTRHPTQKPLALMRWLVRLVTPPGGLALDPFAGSGTTLLAAALEGRKAVGVEREAAYCDIARRRLTEWACEGPGSLFAPEPPEPPGLF